MKTYLKIALPLALVLAAPAHANLTVHPMRASVDPKHGAQIRVYSQSTQPQYVQASMKRVVNPAESNETEVDVDSSEAAIAITPTKFALAGGGNRLIRLVPLQPVERETAYRVYFEGVRGPEETPLESTGQSRANVGVSLVWGLLVNVIPSNGVADMAATGHELVNTGNLRLGITSIADCESGRCTAHDISRSVYPGSSLALPFEAVHGHTIQVRYRLTRDGYKENVKTLAP